MSTKSRHPQGKGKLKAFRESVEKKLCKHWDSAQELGSVVSRSVIQLIKSNPAVGWVRANELADRDATMELLKLRRRVEELETELAKARTSAPKGTEGLAQGEDLHTLRYSFTAKSPANFSSTTWSANCAASWNEIFASLAPCMIHEATDHVLKEALSAFIREEEIKGIQKKKELKGFDLARFSANLDDFQTVKIQFRALGLIAKSEKPRSVKDSGTYWTLTPYGDEVMTRLRAIGRGKDLADAQTETLEKREEGPTSSPES